MARSQYGKIEITFQYDEATTSPEEIVDEIEALIDNASGSESTGDALADFILVSCKVAEGGDRG